MGHPGLDAAGLDPDFNLGRTESLAFQASRKSADLPAEGSKRTAIWGIPVKTYTEATAIDHNACYEGRL